jgi:hypothetical protein
MPKSGVEGGVRRRDRRLRQRPAQLPNAVEGQIAEICHDLAVQAKRMRQLQDQADELRTAIRQWADQPDVESDREATNRGGRR